LTLYAQTLHALLAPRRLVPILLVCAPMVAAQARFSVKAQAGFVAALVCGLFVAIAPYAWRALFARPQVSLWPLRIVLYGALGGIPALVGYALPLWLDLGRTFIATGVNLLVSTALFWVGGWGLARDIELELGLRAERTRQIADGARVALEEQPELEQPHHALGLERERAGRRALAALVAGEQVLPAHLLDQPQQVVRRHVRLPPGHGGHACRDSAAPTFAA